MKDPDWLLNTKNKAIKYKHLFELFDFGSNDNNENTKVSMFFGEIFANAAIFFLLGR